MTRSLVISLWPCPIAEFVGAGRLLYLKKRVECYLTTESPGHRECSQEEPYVVTAETKVMEEDGFG